MTKLLFSAVVALLCASAALADAPTPNPPKGVEFIGQPIGEFDLYVLALSWAPQFCVNTPNKTLPGCLPQPRQYWQEHLTLHGLWQDYANGTYSSYCSTENLLPDELFYAEGRYNLEQNWPNLANPLNGTVADRTTNYDHEWSKHGSCQGLSQQEYFHKALELQADVGTPPELITNRGGNVTRSQLQNHFIAPGVTAPQAAILTCTKDNYLQEIWICYNRAPNSIQVAERIPCPPQSIQASDNCGNSSIQIRAFPDNKN